MSKNTNVIPYTEIQERARSLARVEVNASEKVRGVVQDVYLREISNKFDWDFLWASSSLVTVAEHKLGSVSINTATNAATFSSDAALTADMTGRKIKFQNSDAVYDFNFVSTTDGTVAPLYHGNQNLSNVNYTIFEPKYPLAGDFDRFPQAVDDEYEGGGIYKWQGGKKVGIQTEAYLDYVEQYTGSPSIPQRVHMVEANTAGVPQFEFRPPPKDARVYGYDYIRELRPLKESSAGLVTISAKGTTVTGNTSCRFTDMTTGDWLRVSDFGVSSDSEWYRILAITHDSSLTLSTAFANSGAVNANYVISRAPEMPSRLHPAVLYGTIRGLTLDQTDENFLAYHSMFAETLTDGKRIYLKRIYSKRITGVHEDYEYRR